MDWSKLIEWLHLKPRFVFATGAACAAFLFLPSSVVAQLGLLELRSQHGGWAGAALLISSALLLAHGAGELASKARHSFEASATRRDLVERLENLSPAEAALLHRYISGKTKMQQLPVNSGLAGGLEASKIIFRASNIGTPGSFSFAYNIQPWAWEYLNKHPELLERRREAAVDPEDI